MPRALDELIEALSSLPGIGRKSAARLAFHLLNKPVEDSIEFARRIVDARKKLTSCNICGNWAEEQTCEICTDQSRDGSVICVVEQSSDVALIEATSQYRGFYHVLGGVLSPLDGIGPDELNISSIKQRIGPTIKEIILATNPSTEGEATASYIASQLKDANVRISRLARGLPAGSSLEYADKTTIARAIENRTPAA